MKLKLKSVDTSRASSPTSATPSAVPTPSSTGGFKLKIKTSAPPTPATEQVPATSATPLGPPPTKPKRPYNRKPKDAPKRNADEDISPAPKRPAIDEPKRRISFKLSTSVLVAGGEDEGAPPSAALTETPTSAGPRLKLGVPKRRQSSGPKNLFLTAKKRPPPRPVGVGYDSEASDAEADPAIEQQFVLRMPSPQAFWSDLKVKQMIEEDTAYVRDAVEGRKVGLSLAEGGADLVVRFITRDLKRAIVSVRGHKYAAVLVDLPCLVESMKSWDRKGWWKVADISQMLLVLGPVGLGSAQANVEEEARTYRLPHEVDKELRYAHGLTPPMHWVRKRRFRKRVDYKDIENVEEEVNKLLREDRECEQRGGKVNWQVVDNTSSSFADADMEDAEGEYVDSTEDAFGMGVAQTPSQAQEEEDFDEAALMAGLENMEDEEEGGGGHHAGTDAATTDTADALAANRSGGGGGGGGGGAQGGSSSVGAAETPTTTVETPAAEQSEEVSQGQEESSSDEDEDEGSVGGGGEPVDEDALERAKETAAQKEEIDDLQNEVNLKRQELERTANQLLKQRVRMKLSALENELTMKRKAFSMDDEDDD